MFCPKCGTKNPEDGKFCRSCGVDIGNVSVAMKSSSSSSSFLSSFENNLGSMDCGTTDPKDAVRRTDPNEVYGDAIKSIIMGVGFLVVSMALLKTGVAGGFAWWWAMLIPAFTFFSKGISDLLKTRRMDKARLGGNGTEPGVLLNQTNATTSLPPPSTSFIAPESRYRTGDLAPTSVTDNTTRQLEVNREGETMTLPKH